ncbi:MAG: alpha/beta hydrolase [Acidobacteriota bacterium]
MFTLLRRWSAPPMAAFVALALITTSRLSAQEAATKLHALQFEGHRVEYAVAGLDDTAAPTVVWIHGLGCRSDFWQPQVEVLAGEARLILVDLIGHAGSDKPEIEYTMELYARNVLAVMDAAGVDQAVLVGHSMGVPVVREVARAASERVRAVLAVDGILTLLPIFKQFNGTVTQRFEGDAYEENFGAFVETFFGDFATEEIREAVRSSMLSAPQQMVLSSMRHMYDESVWRPVAIEAPIVSLMAGKAVLPPNYRTMHVEEFPQADYRTAEGAGHFVMLEAPETTTQAVRDLLAASSEN